MNEPDYYPSRCPHRKALSTVGRSSMHLFWVRGVMWECPRCERESPTERWEEVLKRKGEKKQ